MRVLEPERMSRLVEPCQGKGSEPDGLGRTRDIAVDADNGIDRRRARPGNAGFAAATLHELEVDVAGCGDFLKGQLREGFDVADDLAIEGFPIAFIKIGNAVAVHVASGKAVSDGRPDPGAPIDQAVQDCVAGKGNGLGCIRHGASLA